MPDRDFAKFTQKVTKIFRSAGEDIYCSYTKNYCKFARQCHEIRVPDGKEFRFQLRSSHNDEKNDIVIPLRDLLVQNHDFGDGRDRCYLAMFRSEQGFMETWQIGTVMMKNYYVVYDASQYDRGHNYL